MPLLQMSPRLPGVSVLEPEANGPDYRRWKRSIQTAFTAKGTWGHCDGSNPMPMPKRAVSTLDAISNASEQQPSLLEERRAWVKKDRDVKLDIFLSIHDEIKMDVFEVGPPLPPSAMTAKEMMDALEAQFDVFSFEAYHHVFCHFLNLHIDQYATLEEFNAEFLATLDDMRDHGFPMHNLQACSAYFSKLRCTQNPWVAKKLKEWDSLEKTPDVRELTKEMPPWMIIRPLAYKNTPQSPPDSYSEELVGSHDEADEVATLSSTSSHRSRNEEITVHASVEDLTDAFKFPVPGHIPKRMSSKPPSPVELKMGSLPGGKNRPLPPLPPTSNPDQRPSSAPHQTRSSTPTPPTSAPLPVTSSPKPEGLKVPSHSVRSSSPKPSIRSAASPSLRPSKTPPHLAYLPPALPPPSSPLPQIPPTASPDPAAISLGSALIQAPSKPPTSAPRPTSTSPPVSGSWPKNSPLMRLDSSNSSVMSLPIQGVPEKAAGEVGLLLSPQCPPFSTTANITSTPRTGRGRSGTVTGASETSTINPAGTPPQPTVTRPASAQSHSHRLSLYPKNAEFATSSPNLNVHGHPGHMLGHRRGASRESASLAPVPSTTPSPPVYQLNPERGSWESTTAGSQGSTEGRASGSSSRGLGLGLGIGLGKMGGEKEVKERNSLERVMMSDRKRSWSIKSMIHVGRRLEVQEII